jgi:hypothetical protein
MQQKYISFKRSHDTRTKWLITVNTMKATINKCLNFVRELIGTTCEKSLSADVDKMLHFVVRTILNTNVYGFNGYDVNWRAYSELEHLRI